MYSILDKIEDAFNWICDIAIISVIALALTGNI